MPDAELPQWLDKADVHTVAVITLDDGECMTVDVLDFKEGRGELVVDVLSSNRSDPIRGQRGRAIPVGRVVSFEPQPHALLAWPHSDPCRDASFSLARFVLFSTLFLCLTIGSFLLFILLTDRPYGPQESSAIAYTFFAVFFTFSESKGLRPYMFTCPAVQPQIPRLLWRHFGFLVVLFALQTAALAVRPNLPDWWNTEGGGGGRWAELTPFDLALTLLCIGLGYAQVFTNRSLLDRAHREFSA